MIVKYLIFGVLTTLVNYVTFICIDALTANIPLSTVLSWAISVVFAFYTNKYFVFKSNIKENSLKEFATFVSLRSFSGILDLVLMIIFVNVMGFDKRIMKIISNVIVVILNYIFSKLFVFKK